MFHGVCNFLIGVGFQLIAVGLSIGLRRCWTFGRFNPPLSPPPLSTPAGAERGANSHIWPTL
ncbi:hypothetical protein MIZ03_4171 [Rhodoferax lithotrophicus]|uniref:Uncharacterized protein n=1 Tax=Rhodoferax lithotrophicus TaxID=2798804 RepID=A0ABN6DEH6_9BURK|nr:hypothetical protein MIZ03_4171 [Rhodoferax sp. MIZ03]